MENEVNDKIKYKKKPIYSFLKRFFDILLSLIGIILLSWFLLIIALLVKLTSKGPVFYVSERMGRNEKPFRIYKFRSMRVGADKELEALLAQSEREGAFKMKEDPRVTKFGKFIRKTSIDELPQLFNVLNGTMSLVGPRPVVRREYDLMTERQRQRYKVRQGITGLWQVSGRANLSFDEQMDLDLKYVEKRGFFYDLWILLRTIPAILCHKGAE